MEKKFILLFMCIESILIYRIYTINFACIKFMYRNTIYKKYLNSNSNLNRVYKLLTYKLWVYKLYMYSLRPEKTNLGLDVIYHSTTNLDRCISRFIVLGCVTFSTKLVFYGTERV